MTNGDLRRNYKVRAGVNALICPHCEMERSKDIAAGKKRVSERTCASLLVNLTLDDMARLRLAGQARVAANCEGIPYNGKFNHSATITILPQGAQ